MQVAYSVFSAYNSGMKRDWLWIAAGIALGEVCAYLLGSVIAVAVIAGITAILLFVFRKIVSKSDRRRMMIITCVAFLSGFLRMGADNLTYRDTKKLDDLSRYPVTQTFETTIDRIEVRETDLVLTCGQILVYAAKNAAGTEAAGKAAGIEATGKAAGTGTSGNSAARSPEVPGCPYEIGNRIRITGTFTRMKEARNPGGFDYRTYYRSLGITHRCFAECVEVTDAGGRVIPQAVFVIRQKLLAVISDRFPPEDAGFLRAALLGDKTMLDEDMADMYRRNGIAHLLAISGLHVAILGMGLHRFLRGIGLNLWASGGIATFLLILYCLLTGGSVSVVRAVIMLVMVFLSECLGRKNDLLNSAGLAAAALLLLQPYNIFSCSFLLSFGAVAGIGGPAAIICKRLGLSGNKAAMHSEKTEVTQNRNNTENAGSAEHRKDAENTGAAVIRKGTVPVDPKTGYFRGKCRDCLRTFAVNLVVSLTIQLFTLPVTAYFFFEVPLYGLFLNLIVIPLMTYILVSGLLSFALPVAAGPGHFLLKFYTFLCRQAERLPFHSILIGRPELWQIILYYCCFFALLSFGRCKPKIRRLLSSMWGRATAFSSLRRGNISSSTAEAPATERSEKMSSNPF